MTALPEVRILTVWQPWASLLTTVRRPDGLPVKSIETRPMGTSWRGPVIIHAAQRPPTEELRLGPGELGASMVTEEFVTREMADGSWSLLELCNEERWKLPLGACVGIADLADVLPMVGEDSDDRAGEARIIVRDVDLVAGSRAYLWRTDPNGGLPLNITTERPYGHFESGRYGWIFENARALRRPIPWRGAQGLRRADPALVEQVLGMV